MLWAYNNFFKISKQKTFRVLYGHESFFMKININNFIKTTPIAFKDAKKEVKSSNLWSDKKDSFVHSASSSEAKQPLQTESVSIAKLDEIFAQYLLSEANAIFDTTYPEVMKFNSFFNPVFQKLNIKKPTIKIEEFQNKSMRACYSFIENTISFSKTLLEEDLFLLCQRNENKQINRNFGFYPESLVAEEKEKLKEKGEICTIKLTDKEKEFYLESICAHEIRHLLQAHLVASTESCTEAFKESIVTQADLITILKAQMNKSYKEILRQIEECKANGEEIPNEILQTLEEYAPDGNKDYSYGLEYTPSELLPSDTKIKFSVLQQDKRNLSVKEDLLPAEISKLTEGNDNKALKYVCNLLEIDAFHHAYEYILSKIQPDNEEVRKEVIYSMALESRKSSSLGIDLLELLNKLPEGMKT